MERIKYMIINGLMGGYFLSVKGIIYRNHFSIRDTIWHWTKKRELKIFLSVKQCYQFGLHYPTEFGVLFYELFS